MDQWLNKLERRFGKYAIPDLIRYVVGIYCIGAILGMASAIGILRVDIYYQYLCLDMDKVFHGQIHRLVTFLLEPYGFTSGFDFVFGVIFFIFKVNLFFLFGRSLEQAWGSFRFNMYLLSGYLLNILAALILYLSPLHGSIYNSGMEYIYLAMFFAFAVINPNMELLLMLILPIKVKWLAIIDGVYMGYVVLSNLKNGFLLLMDPRPMSYQYGLIYISVAVAILVSFANFLIFFLSTRNYQRISPKNIKRKREFRQKTARPAGKFRHQCAICGRTNEDSPDLEFRFCSKCEGNYEYCSEHLFTHEHVKKFM